jgi:hypothetical protein
LTFIQQDHLLVLITEILSCHDVEGEADYNDSQDYALDEEEERQANSMSSMQLLERRLLLPWILDWRGWPDEVVEVVMGRRSR